MIHRKRPLGWSPAAVPPSHLRTQLCRVASACLVIASTCVSLGCDKKDQQTSEEEQRAAAAKGQQAQLEANEKIAEARREGEKSANEAARARSEVKVSFQKDVDAIDRKISALKERAVGATGSAKKNAAAAMAETDSRRSTLQANLRKLETETGAGWDTAKIEVGRDIAAVNAALDSVETTVTDRPAH
jgi:uncharacterized protein YPO0396